jgi:hypothetical protein
MVREAEGQVVTQILKRHLTVADKAYVVLYFGRLGIPAAGDCGVWQHTIGKRAGQSIVRFLKIPLHMLMIQLGVTAWSDVS